MRRTLIRAVPAALLGLTGVAAAAPQVRGLSPLPEHLSARCAPLAHLPSSAQITTQVFAAHVSVANCTVEEAMNRVQLIPDDASTEQLEAVVAPSITMLDEVIRAGDSYWKMIAEDAKRDIYESMAVRMRESIPSGDVASRDAIEPDLAIWLDRAELARLDVVALARAHSDLARRDAVVAGIVERDTALEPWVAQGPR